MDNKPLAGLIASLHSGNEKSILHTISHLRSMGNTEYLAHLFPLLLDPSSEHVKKAVLELLCDLKSQKAVPQLIQIIGDPSFASIRKDLIICCWESRLDFSDYLGFFVNMVTESDFDTAFEAFTVIDSMESFPDEALRHHLLEKIKQSAGSSSGTKASLLKELYQLLK